MKTYSFIAAFSAVFSLMALPATGVTIPAEPDPGLLSPTWGNIDDCSYAQRAQFFAGLGQLEATVARQVREITAKHAAINNPARPIDPADWKLTMTEMINAQSYLQAMAEEIRKAAPETWDDEKEKVGDAWARTQAACQEALFNITD